VVVGGPIARADVPGLCRRVGPLLEGCDAALVVCDVSACVDPDAVMVDALARLQLTARRLGRQIRLRHAPGELQELLALVGLCDVLPLGAELRPEPSRQPEEREQAFGVEEGVDPGDPAAGHLDDLERERLVAAIWTAGPVLPERRRAVRRGREHARAATRRP
jgi:ABC-type transporter Mla MlaB component